MLSEEQKTSTRSLINFSGTLQSLANIQMVSRQVISSMSPSNYLLTLWLHTKASPSETGMSPVNCLKVVVFSAPITPSRPGEKITCKLIWEKVISMV